MLMFTIFAHAGHSHDTDMVSGLDHCTPIIITAGLIIAGLLGVILYLLANRQPKKQTKKSKVEVKKK
jgi:xanthine/uracil permease